MDHNTTSSSSSSWHKELERSLSSAGAGDSGLYEGHGVAPAQHFSSGLPSLLQRQSSERSAWVPQWPQMWSMAAPLAAPQHRSHAQVWGDPTFRPFFPDPSQDPSVSSAGFRSPWEAPHDVKTIETVLNSVVEQQPLNYRTDIPPFRQQAENLTAASSSSPATSSPAHSQGEGESSGPHSDQFYQQNPGEVKTFQHPGPGYTTATLTAPDYANSPSEPANLTLNTAEKNITEPETSGEENRPEPSPQDLSCDRQPEEYPRDYSASYERRENNRGDGEQGDSYDIIKNMTEKYGEPGVKQTEEVPSQETLSGGTDEHKLPELPILQQGNVAGEKNVESMEAESNEMISTEEPGDRGVDGDFKPKPIKLKIARGEVVANTALEQGGVQLDDEELEDDGDVEMKEEAEESHNPLTSEENIPPWALDKRVVLELQETLETDSELKERVSEIVGEDVLNIFATAVEEAESSQDTKIDNKNVVFLYYAVKNSTNLDMSNVNKHELEPLSNLALSVPLLADLLKFLVKDQNIKEQMQAKIGAEDFQYFEKISRTASDSGSEFLQDTSVTSRVVFLYHTARNLVLSEAFRRLGSLYTKIDHIIESVETTEDVGYNVAVARFKTLISAPWNQQVIAAEAMKFDFDFLNEVYTFWKRVIARRNKPEKKPKKPLKMKISPAAKAADTYDIFGRPKRSTRRRNEMVTYDEDIMQDCNIKPGSSAGEEEVEGSAPAE